MDINERIGMMDKIQNFINQKLMNKEMLREESVDLHMDYIKTVCEKHNLRIGQLIYLVEIHFNLNLFYVSDDALITYIDKFIKSKQH